MKKIVSVLTFALLCAGTLSAQQRWDTGGIIIDPNAITAMDLFNYSNVSHNFGTARSMAMGGAVTSLGADMSSMSVNPAGMGMYLSNDVTFTPMIGVTKTITEGTKEFDGGSRHTRFSVADFGIVFKAYEGSRGVLAVNVGFGYNRLADFNYRTSFSRGDNASSLSGVFARQLADSRYTSYDLSAGENPNFSWWNIDPTYWGAALGYKCGLVDDPYGQWQPDAYGYNPSVDQFMTIDSRGSIGEYDFSGGLNINNKLYVGFTLGIQSLHQRRDIYYGEEYSYAQGDEPAGWQLDWFNYEQTSIVNGTGVNFKAGLTYRPIPALRIGVAVHTPTWYSLDFKYQGAMVSQIYDNAVGRYLIDPEASTDVLKDYGSNSWNFRTPARLLLGASYTFGNRAIISVDYERDWYNGIRTGRTPVGRGIYKDFFRENFKGANTLRIGAELKLGYAVSLRAGYGVTGSMLRNHKLIYSSPVTYRTQYCSAGLGFLLGRSFYIDLAYQYLTQKQTTAKLFYATDMVGESDGTWLDDYSGDYTTKLHRHNIVMTLGLRF
ncbi:MAG: outer membrane protein transport protein [Alistipes sp.]|nr:outer membrane protein transport protein [Alistipes sp.]